MFSLEALLEAVILLLVFAIVYTWTARRGLWGSASNLELPGSLHFAVWYLPAFWSFGSIFVLAGLVALAEFRMTGPLWLWSASLAGVIADIDLLFNPRR